MSIVENTFLSLLCIEGAAFMLLAMVVLFRFLAGISVHRQALFSVFLAIPNTFLRTLASKSVSIGDEDAESEDGEMGEWQRVGRNSWQAWFWAGRLALKVVTQLLQWLPMQCRLALLLA